MQGTSPPTWLPGHGTTGAGACSMDDQGRLFQDIDHYDLSVTIGQSGEGPFTVSQIGPSGSGRYWDIGVSFKVASKLYGFCFLTTTTGWKHVGHNRELSDRLFQLIQPVQDVDEDGDGELVIASSIYLNDSSRCGEGTDCAMSVTAYDRRGDRFVKDSNSTRILLSSMRDAYRRAASAKRVGHADRKHYAEAAAVLTKLVAALGAVETTRPNNKAARTEGDARRR